MPEIRFRSLVDLNFQEVADLFNRCFEGYLIPVHLTADLAAARSRRDCIDHARSFLTVKEDQPVAIALLAPRGHEARLAGMGVVSEARGLGIGKATVEEFLHRIHAGGFRGAVLEVFEQNVAAVKLYESFGFTVTQRLLGFRREPTPTSGGHLREVPVPEFVRIVGHAPAESWLQSAEQAATISLPTRCWTADGEDFAAFAPADEGKAVIIASLAIRSDGRRLFDAIQHAYPNSAMMLPQVFPERLAPVLEALGFVRLELNQFEMRLGAMGWGSRGGMEWWSDGVME